MSFSINTVTLLYLIASICFIQALKGLSHPTTSIRGNIFGMVGMSIAILTTFGLIGTMSEFLNKENLSNGFLLVFAGIILGGGIGATMAKKVEMTKMPELVAFMHSMVGLAAVFIAIAAVVEPYALNITEKGQMIPTGNRLELFLGASIGAITFSGSVIAFGLGPRVLDLFWVQGVCARGTLPFLANGTARSSGGGTPRALKQTRK